MRRNNGKGYKCCGLYSLTVDYSLLSQGKRTKEVSSKAQAGGWLNCKPRATTSKYRMYCIERLRLLWQAE